jgi:predicted dehydrogenase
MAQRRYSTAIVGTGGIADAHAQALRDHEGRSRLVAVVDVDPDRAQAFAAAWNVPAAYPGLTELLQDAKVDGSATECASSGSTEL